MTERTFQAFFHQIRRQFHSIPRHTDFVGDLKMTEHVAANEPFAVKETDLSANTILTGNFLASVHRQHSWDKLGRLKKGVFLAP